MTPDNAGPISRPFPLYRVTPEGVDAEVVATPEERAALATDLSLVAIHGLVARFRVTGTPRRVRVAGRVSARIEQTCVVSLDPFETALDEDVEVEFETPPTGREVAKAVEVEADLDAPEELVGDRIDLGTVTAEFLALALDPYPKKPGASFDGGPAEEVSSPFAGLADLQRGSGDR